MSGGTSSVFLWNWAPRFSQPSEHNHPWVPFPTPDDSQHDASGQAVRIAWPAAPVTATFLLPCTTHTDLGFPPLPSFAWNSRYYNNISEPFAFLLNFDGFARHWGYHNGRTMQSHEVWFLRWRRWIQGVMSAAYPGTQVPTCFGWRATSKFVLGGPSWAKPTAQLHAAGGRSLQQYWTCALAGWGKESLMTRAGGNARWTKCTFIPLYSAWKFPLHHV